MSISIEAKINSMLFLHFTDIRNFLKSIVDE